jgi:hypothetical protein
MSDAAVLCTSSGPEAGVYRHRDTCGAIAVLDSPDAILTVGVAFGHGWYDPIDGRVGTGPGWEHCPYPCADRWPRPRRSWGQSGPVATWKLIVAKVEVPGLYIVDGRRFVPLEGWVHERKARR